MTYYWPTTAIQFFLGPAPTEAHDTEARRALAEWQDKTGMQFTEVATSGQDNTIDVQFHPDPLQPFLRGQLAIGNPPPPGIWEPLAGDIFVSDLVTPGGKRDLYSVLLHEIGHSLGLEDCNDSNAVMYRYFRKKVSLGAADIAAWEARYATEDLE